MRSNTLGSDFITRLSTVNSAGKPSLLAKTIRSRRPEPVGRSGSDHELILSKIEKNAMHGHVSALSKPLCRRPRRSPQASVHRLLGASKGLGLVGLLLAVLIVAQTQTRRWLLDRWAAGFSELPPAEQITRLIQIDALGDYCH